MNPILLPTTQDIWGVAAQCTLPEDTYKPKIIVIMRKQTAQQVIGTVLQYTRVVDVTVTVLVVLSSRARGQ